MAIIIADVDSTKEEITITEIYGGDSSMQYFDLIEEKFGANILLRPDPEWNDTFNIYKQESNENEIYIADVTSDYVITKEKSKNKWVIIWMDGIEYEHSFDSIDDALKQIVETTS